MDRRENTPGPETVLEVEVDKLNHLKNLLSSKPFQLACEESGITEPDIDEAIEALRAGDKEKAAGVYWKLSRGAQDVAANFNNLMQKWERESNSLREGRAEKV